MLAVGACQHTTFTHYNEGRGIYQSLVCGDVLRCSESRIVRAKRDRKRLEKVQYLAPPILLTLTSATVATDAKFLARKFVRERIRSGATVAASVRADPESIAPFMRHARDFADPYRDAGEFSRRVSRLTQALHLQARRQLRPGYAESRHARKLLREYGNAHVVTGASDARLRIRRLEAGEKTLRPHAHCVSDFTFIDMRKDHRGTRRGASWFGDLCARFGLGHPQYQKRERREMKRAWDAGGAASVAHYLTDYLSKSDPAAPWPWRSHQRLLSAVRGALPPREPNSEWKVAFLPVAVTARLKTGAVLHPRASYFNAQTGETREHDEAPTETKSADPRKSTRRVSAGFRDGEALEAVVPDGCDGASAGARGGDSSTTWHECCSDSLDKERGISARRRRPRWEADPASVVSTPCARGSPLGDSELASIEEWLEAAAAAARQSVVELKQTGEV